MPQRPPKRQKWARRQHRRPALATEQAAERLRDGRKAGEGGGSAATAGAMGSGRRPDASLRDVDRSHTSVTAGRPKRGLN